VKGIEKANSISFSVQNGCMFQKLVQVLAPRFENGSKFRISTICEEFVHKLGRN
jgi:hypothetical protein